MLARTRRRVGRESGGELQPPGQHPAGPWVGQPDPRDVDQERTEPAGPGPGTGQATTPASARSARKADTERTAVSRILSRPPPRGATVRAGAPPDRARLRRRPPPPPSARRLRRRRPRPSSSSAAGVRAAATSPLARASGTGTGRGRSPPRRLPPGHPPAGPRPRRRPGRPPPAVRRSRRGGAGRGAGSPPARGPGGRAGRGRLVTRTQVDRLSGPQGALGIPHLLALDAHATREDPGAHLLSGGLSALPTHGVPQGVGEADRPQGPGTGSPGRAWVHPPRTPGGTRCERGPANA